MGNLAAILVAVLVSDALDPCATRIERRVFPIYPMPFSGRPLSILQHSGPCQVVIKYEMSKYGNTKLVSYDSEERCLVFQRSAVQAFGQMAFRRGDAYLECEFTFVFRWPPT